MPPVINTAFPANLFRLRLDGKIVPNVIRVSPLTRQTDFTSHREEFFSHITGWQPQATTFQPVVIDRQVSYDTTFEEWANSVCKLSNGTLAPPQASAFKDLAIEIMNPQGALVLRYLLYRCWPSEYQPLPELSVTAGPANATERIVLQVQSWERDSTLVGVTVGN